MKAEAITLLIAIWVRYTLSYSELRIYKDNIKEQTLQWTCHGLGPAYKLHFINKGYFVSIATIKLLNLTIIQKLYSNQLILLVETDEIPNEIMSQITQFAAVFMPNKIIKEKQITSLPILGCECHIQTITNLIKNYDIMNMSSQVIGEIYHTQYFYSPHFVYKASIAILIYTWIMILPKLYYLLFRINDPFQKVWLFSYALCCVNSVLLFYLAMQENNYYNENKLKPEKDMLYYLINHLDSIFKAYSMTLLIALSNGVLYEYQIDIKQSGWYLILFQVLQVLFGLDDILNYFLKKNETHLGYSLIQLALEMKDMILYMLIFKGINFNIKELERKMIRELPRDRSLYVKNFNTKICYLRKTKIGLVMVLMLNLVMFMICKSGFTQFITGIVIPIMKMIGNMTLLTVINIAFFPHHFTSYLWLDPKIYDHVYCANMHLPIDLRYHYKNHFDITDKPFAIINPFIQTTTKTIYVNIKIGYLVNKEKFKKSCEDLELDFL